MIIFFIDYQYVRILSLILVLGVFLVSLLLMFTFDNFTTAFQFQFFITWLDSLNIYYSLGVDGISIFFIILTTFLMPLCFLVSWINISYRIKEFLLCMLFVEIFLLHVFSVLDFFFLSFF